MADEPVLTDAKRATFWRAWCDVHCGRGQVAAAQMALDQAQSKLNALLTELHAAAGESYEFVVGKDGEPVYQKKG